MEDVIRSTAQNYYCTMTYLLNHQQFDTIPFGMAIKVKLQNNLPNDHRANKLIDF